MNYWICETCGTQFAASEQPPQQCAICCDERQYIGSAGQKWTTLDQLQNGRFHNEFRLHEPGLTGIGTTPSFAIGERALLLQSTHGNILWDCMSLLDDETALAVEQKGGIAAIAISHPHYYTTMVEWAKRFSAPIYLHEADRQWVMRPDEHIVFWSGEVHPLWDDITLRCLGGHFAGGTVLHWPAGAEGQGALLSGDIIQVVPDRRWVSFMRSYPNLIPLPAAIVERIAAAVEPLSFDRLYGAWFDRVISTDAHAAVQRSARRYVQALFQEREER